MSTTSLKRIDVINYLEDTKKIRPNHDEYKKEYVKFVCEQFKIKESEVHYEVFIDISKIKKMFTECHRKFDKMKNKNKKLEQKLLMGPWDPGPGSRMTGPKCWDPSTGTQTLRIGMFGSQVLGPTVPGPK